MQCHLACSLVRHLVQGLCIEEKPRLTAIELPMGVWLAVLVECFRSVQTMARNVKCDGHATRRLSHLFPGGTAVEHVYLLPRAGTVVPPTVLYLP